MRAALALVPLLVACGGSSADLVFTPENNYSFSGELAIEESEVMSQTDLTLDWSGMTTDLRGRPFDGTVDQVMFVEFRLSKADILDKAVRNDLFQSDSQTQWLFDPAATDTSMLTSQFEIIGNVFDPADLTEDSERVWLASLTDLPDGRFDLLNSRFVTPLDAGTETTVAFQDGDTVLTADVDMHTMPPMVTEEGVGPYTIDWSQITKDVNGNVFDSLLADELLIAHYADFAGPEEVEGIFLQLDEQASELYRMSVYGATDAALEDAVDASGKGFGGFTADGVWMVGVTCTTCISPVPLLIGVVEVE